MHKLYVQLIIALILSNAWHEAIYASDFSALSPEVLQLLGKTTEGKQALKDLDQNKFGDVRIEIVRELPHLNGKFEILDNGRAKILIFKDQSSEAVAKTLVHEFQHLRDLTVTDARVDGHKIGELLGAARHHVVSDGSAKTRDSSQSREFYGGFLLCFELRAYSLARTLEKEGVKTGELPEDELKFILTQQLAPLNISLSTNEIRNMKNECERFHSFGGFMKNLARQTGVTSRSRR